MDQNNLDLNDQPHIYYYPYPLPTYSESKILRLNATKLQYSIHNDRTARAR